MYSTSDSLPLGTQLIYYGFLFVVCVITFYGYRWWKKNRNVDIEGTPVLLAYYTDGTEIIPAKKGKFGRLNFVAIATVNKGWAAEGGESALIYMIDLPFKTKVHLLGIPKKSNAVQIDPGRKGSLMEKVHLEGQYDEYFNLYCEKGMQDSARYVLDPAAMEFTIDFCQSHSWEISGNSLYFVQSSAMKRSNDPTNMYEDLPTFIEQITPALAESYTPPPQITLSREDEDANGVPIPIQGKQTYPCPVCKSPMIAYRDFYACPNGEGIFLLGAKISEVKDKEIPNIGNARRDSQVPLTCPVCHSQMEHVAYGGSKTMIDSCTKCPYRWLDAGELVPKS